MIKYTGFLASYSGMSSAARAFVMALHKAGGKVTTEFIQNLTSSSDLGEEFKLCQDLNGIDMDWKFKIIHLTPDLITKHLEPMKYHIFHLFWETDSLPKWWVWSLNLADEVWTGSEWNKQTFIKSGVKKPIKVFPQPFELHGKYRPMRLKNHKGFMFYSIFQWIERKDPKSLLQAYWREFEGEENVSLLLKTYKETFSNIETMEILKEVVEWKKELNQRHYPKVFLYPELMSQYDLLRLNQMGDCFVTTHRGEGWGRNIAEAMAFGKPVISTNLGGIHEHIPTGHFYPVDYQMCNVFNMEWAPWYSKKQKWGQVDITDLRKKMRLVFNNQEIAKKTGGRGKLWVQNYLNYKIIGKQMLKRLEEI